MTSSLRDAVLQFPIEMEVARNLESLPAGAGQLGRDRRLRDPVLMTLEKQKPRSRGFRGLLVNLDGS